MLLRSFLADGLHHLLLSSWDGPGRAADTFPLRAGSEFSLPASYTSDRNIYIAICDVCQEMDLACLKRGLLTEG